MGLTEVIGDVRKDGEARAQALLDEATAEATRLLDAAKEKVAAYHADRLAQAERDAVQAEAQILSHAESESRKIALTAEAEMREELRATLLAGFGTLADATRAKHVKALVKQGKDVVGKGTVFGAKVDEDTLKAQRTFAYGGVVDIVGGIVIESEDGLTRLDLSYETLLADLWRDVLKHEAGLFE